MSSLNVVSGITMIVVAMVGLIVASSPAPNAGADAGASATQETGSWSIDERTNQGTATDTVGSLSDDASPALASR